MDKFNFSEIVIDRVFRAHKFDFNGRRMWTATQIKDPTLECGSETVYSTDAIGSNIMAFDRSKSAKFSFSNALMHLDVLASQLGTEKKVVSETAKRTMTCVEFLKVDVTDGAKVTLSHKPIEEAEGVPFKYLDKVDTGLAAVATYELGSTPTKNFSVSERVVTLPTEPKWAAGDVVAVKYKYEAVAGVVIEDNANEYGEAGEFVVEAFCYNPCDKANKKLLNIVFPNAKEDANFSLTITNELTHPVTINAMQDYCSENKCLFRVEACEAA